MGSIIHFYEGRWCFWNELWSARIGEYATEKEAARAAAAYARQYKDQLLMGFGVTQDWLEMIKEEIYHILGPVVI